MLYSILQCESEMELQKQQGLVNFITLKKLNRLSHMFCKDAREQTHEVRGSGGNVHMDRVMCMGGVMHMEG